jgi:O-succinylbenzoate-CoA ligase
MSGSSMSLGQMLGHRARRHPERLALVDATRGQRYTYQELDRRANRIAGGLARLGVQPGDRVAILMPNGIEFVESYFAVARLGAVSVPLNVRLAPPELDFILRDAGVETLLYHGEHDETVAALRDGGLELRHLVGVGDRYDQLRESGSEAEPTAFAGGEDPLFIMYTSGTTGRPKGAVHTHASFLSASTAVNLTCDIREGDRELVVLPLFHIGALLPLTWELQRGGTAVVLRSFDADLAIRVLESERITTGLVVPTIFQTLLDHPKFDSIDHSSLRSIVVGGAPVPPPLARRSKEAGITALQDYGSTEAAVVTIASEDEFLAKPMSAGRPLIGTEVRILDNDGRELPTGDVGEIVARGSHLMAGYWRRPDATAAALRDGWFHTGDLGSLDQAGCLFVRDRKNDLIISGGENIYPAEIERVLAEWPRLREAAVIGQPSAKWGESPVAVIVPQPGPPITADELIDFCRGRLAGYKIPREVVVLDSLPRTPTGKVQKHLLRLRFPGPAPM